MFFCLVIVISSFFFFFSSRRRHTRWNCDWSSDVCSSDLLPSVEYAVLQQWLVNERGDPDGGPGNRRQPSGGAFPDPVHLAGADRRDGGTGLPRPRQQCRGGSQGEPLPLAQDLGGQIAPRLAQPCHGPVDI